MHTLHFLYTSMLESSYNQPLITAPIQVRYGFRSSSRVSGCKKVLAVRSGLQTLSLKPSNIEA